MVTPVYEVSEYAGNMLTVEIREAAGVEIKPLQRFPYIQTN